MVGVLLKLTLCNSVKANMIVKKGLEVIKRKRGNKRIVITHTGAAHS